MVLRPSIMQPSTEMSQIDVPQRDMEQDCLKRPLVRLLKHPSSYSYWSDLEMALLSADEFAGLSEVTNEKQGEKVRFVNDIVKLKNVHVVEFRPYKDIAHFRYDTAGQVSCGRQLQPRWCRSSTQKDQHVSCDGRLLDLFGCEVRGKADRACRSPWG